jgi:hypothetical protein
MRYREYGKTGEKISIISFGGMRFPNVADEDGMAQLALHAFQRGVNYFDTAPGYCKDKSEIIVGKAVMEMKKRGEKFFVSTKSGEDDGDKLREQLERSLKRLHVDAVDFFHCWCVVSLADWEERKSGGAVAAIRKACDEGLIRHPCISTHLAGEDIAKVLAEGFFDGILLGYSAVNFPYRVTGIEAAKNLGLGVMIMNPLGGGLIPKHPEQFAFIQRPGDPSLVASALRFVLSTPGVTSALIGCDSLQHIDEAVALADSFQPLNASAMEEIKAGVKKEFDNLCTLCRYCDVCGEKIPVYKYMSAYNYLAIENSPKAMSSQLKWHWGLDNPLAELANCTQCGRCAEECTQHLPILERFREMTKILEAEKVMAKAKSG